MIKNDLKGNPDFDSFIFFDFETDGSQVLDVGVLVRDNYSVLSFTEFLDYVFRTKNGTFVAHYGAGFDFLFMVKPLLSYGFTITYGVSGSSGIAMFCDRGKQKLRFIDSYKVTLASLKKLGQALGTDTTKLDIDVLPAELKRTDPDRYYQYLERDCRTLRESYLKFMEQFSEYNLGKNPPLTTASLALKVFKNTLTDPILCSNHSTREWERQSYFGGICYVREPGEFDVNVYDVNSMYPAVMVEHDYPTSYVGSWVDKLCGMGLYEVEFDDYDGMPWIFNVDGKLTRDRGRAILDNLSVEYLSTLTTVKVLRGYHYRRCGRIFGYYRDLYELRLKAKREGNDAKQYALKILLNSLYGKFGQRDFRKVISNNTPQVRDFLRSRSIPFHVSADQDLIFYEIEHFQTCAFPAIASMVTLHARRKLRQFSEGVPVLYADTDSLHVPSYISLPVSDELGGLKLEFTGKAVYLGKKLYALKGEKLVHKGIPKGMLTEQDFLDILLSDRQIRVDYQSMPSPRDVLELGREPGVMIAKHRTVRKLL